MKTIKILQKRKHKGIAMIWGAIFFIAVLGLMAIMLDYARGYLAVHQLQNAADAAALAGSRYVPIVYDPNSGNTNLSIAKDIAYDYAIEHTAANDSVYLDETTTIDPTLIDPIYPYDASTTDDIIIGRYVDWSGLFYVDHQNPDAMMVIARRDGTASKPELPLLFGSLYSVDKANYTRFAIAKVIDAYGSGVLALGECDCPGLFFGGSGAADDLTILNGGSLYVNASYNPGGDTGAIDQTGNSDPDLNLDRIFTVGGIDGKLDWPEYTDIHDYTDGVQPQPDPYAYLPDNSDDYDPSVIAEPNISTSGTYYPGYYPGGIQLSDTSAVVNLMPGNYYLGSLGEDASINMNGGLVAGEGVTLHIIGDADVGIDVQGNANIDISAPTDGIYEGIGIYQKRDPTYDCTKSCIPWPNSYPLSEFNGTGDLIIDGVVYMPHNKLTLGGTGYIYLTRVVADRFYIYGNGQKIVNYMGERKIAPASYLVK